MTMKDGIKLMLVTSVLAAGGHANVVRADDDYGCRILICLGNPASNGGPWAPDTCRPAMDHLMDDLHDGRGWPQCKDSDITVRQNNTPVRSVPCWHNGRGDRRMGGRRATQGRSPPE